MLKTSWRKREAKAANQSPPERDTVDRDKCRHKNAALESSLPMLVRCFLSK
jgi:hypothetical protein